MTSRRAQARLCGRDARATRAQTCPCKREGGDQKAANAITPALGRVNIRLKWRIVRPQSRACARHHHPSPSPIKGEGICRSLFAPDFSGRAWLKPSGFSPSRE